LVVEITKILLDKIDLSELFDDVINRAKITLFQEIIYRDFINDLRDLEKFLEKYSDSAYRFSLKPIHEEYELSIYSINGYIIGSILDSPSEKIRGIDALRSFSEKVGSDKIVIEVYKLPINVVEEIIGKDNLEKIVSVSSTVAEQHREVVEKKIVVVEKAEEAGKRVEEAIVETKGIDYGKIKHDIPEYIKRFGLDPLGVEVVDEAEFVVVYVDVASPSLWIDLETLVYGVASRFLEIIGSLKKVLKVQVRLADKVKAIIFAKPEDLRIAKVIALLAEAFNDNGIPINKTEQKIVGNNLFIEIRAKKPVYPDVSVSDVIKSIYLKIREIWGDNVEVTVRIGMFTRIRYP